MTDFIKKAATAKNLAEYLAADETLILCQGMLEAAGATLSPESPMIEELELKFDEMAAA